MIRVLQSKDVDTSGKTWYRFSGDNTDSKPTGEYPAGSGRTVAVGSRFFENGTEIVYVLKSDGWTAVGQQEVTLIEKTITENGEYDPADDNADGYSSVNVDVEPNLTTKSITANGTYTATTDNADGYSSVTVNVTPYVEAESEEPSEAQSGDYVWFGYSLTGSDVTLIIRVTQDDTPPSGSGVNFVTSVIIN